MPSSSGSRLPAWRAVLLAAVVIAALVLVLAFFVGTGRTLVMAAVFIVLPLFLIAGLAYLVERSRRATG